jgi:ATP-binding cassette subfamily B protein
MKVIKSFSREDKTARYFDDVQDKTAKANLAAINVSASIQPSVMVMRVIGTSLILYFGALFVRSGEITIGTLVVFTEYQMQYFSAADPAHNSLRSISICNGGNREDV